MNWITVLVPEGWVAPLVQFVYSVGGWASPTDGCECVYLPFIKFILEV